MITITPPPPPPQETGYLKTRNNLLKTECFITPSTYSYLYICGLGGGGGGGTNAAIFHSYCGGMAGPVSTIYMAVGRRIEVLINFNNVHAYNRHSLK